MIDVDDDHVFGIVGRREAGEPRRGLLARDLRGPGLGRDRVLVKGESEERPAGGPGHRRCRQGPAHVRQRRGARGHRAARGGIDGGSVLEARGQMRGDPGASVRDGGVGRRQLQGGHEAAALPDRGVQRIPCAVLVTGSAVVACIRLEQSGASAIRLFGVAGPGPGAIVVAALLELRAHLLTVGHRSGGLARKIDPCGRAQSEVPSRTHDVLFGLRRFQASVAFPHLVAEPVKDRVTGDGQGTCQRHRPVGPRLVVREGLSPHREQRRAVVRPVEVETRFTGGDRCESLERGSRRGDRLCRAEDQRLARLLIGQIRVFGLGQPLRPDVRVIGRVGGHRPDLTVTRIHDDHRSTSGFVALPPGSGDRFAQSPLGHLLCLDVQRGDQRLPCNRLLGRTALWLPLTVQLPHGLPRFALQHQVVLRLQTRLARTLTQIAEQMCRIGLRGIVAYRGPADRDARQTGVVDRQSDRDGYVRQDRNGLPRLTAVAGTGLCTRLTADQQPRLQVGHGHRTHLGQSLQGGLADRLIGGHLQRRPVAGQKVPVAVDDVAASGRQVHEVGLDGLRLERKV